MAEQGYILNWPIQMFRYFLTGQDAISWLQGQVTNDLRGLKEAKPVRCCLVKSTGQLIDTLEVELTSGGLEILADGNELESRVAQYVIMEDVGIGRHPVSPSDVPQDAAAYLIQSLEQSRAIAKLDSDEKTLPPELGKAFELEHIAYDKGCFVGQEVLQRIHSRGHVNRLWQVLSVNELVEKGAEVHAGEKIVGHVTRRGFSEKYGWLAGAMLKTARDGQLLIAGQSVSLLETP